MAKSEKPECIEMGIASRKIDHPDFSTGRSISSVRDTEEAILYRRRPMS
jgi:hypothetical protein